MKKLSIKNTEYKRILRAFTAWLETVGYAATTVYGTPNYVREYFNYLETKAIEISSIANSTNTEYIDYLLHRKNERKSGGLSIGHINKSIDAMYKLDTYLIASNQGSINWNIKYLKQTIELDRTVLTLEQIHRLYAATDNSPLGQRDKAMLSIYYGCGLRKSEGLQLELSAINFDKKRLYISKTKTNQERYVPINKKCISDIETYVFTGRKLLLSKSSGEEKLFISSRGKAMTKQTMYIRFKTLLERANIHVDGGLHLLRHSIATHLLQQGMELEKIALFLGHKSLDSTQIYTHIKNRHHEEI